SLPSVATGTWVAAGNMAAARSGACTAVLSDGRLLTSGGSDAHGPTATADLFSTTGSWSAAVSMNSPRSHQSCAVLQDGRVLVAGGTTSGGGITNSAEIYDPSSDKWSQVGLMNDARSGATASILQDGRVLIAGGQNSGGAVNTLEIFDPDSGNFLSAGTMSSPRQDHAAAVLSDGRVLIVGGSSDGTNALNTSDIYDPKAGSVTPGPATGAMATPRSDATGAALTRVDGRLLIAGGSSASAELYGFATVKTDAADYPPGSIVTITGTGWQPGETVTLTLVESPLIDTHGPYTVTADAFGNISDSSFATDAHDENIRFYLTAAGSQSQAQNTFTDSKPQTLTITSATSVTVPPGGTANYSLNLSFGGTAGSCSSPMSLAYTSRTPTGATTTFTPTSISGSTSTAGTGSLAIATTASTAPGSYPFTITASQGSCSQSGTASATGTLVV